MVPVLSRPAAYPIVAEWLSCASEPPPTLQPVLVLDPAPVTGHGPAGPPAPTSGTRAPAPVHGPAPAPPAPDRPAGSLLAGRLSVARWRWTPGLHRPAGPDRPQAPVPRFGREWEAAPAAPHLRWAPAALPPALWLNGFPRHDVAVAGSWRHRARVREVAARLRAALAPRSVYDFTDPACRVAPECPPEANPAPWAPWDAAPDLMLAPPGSPGPGPTGDDRPIPASSAAWDGGPAGRVLTYGGYLAGLRGLPDAVLCNRLAYSSCRVVVLVLPAGDDAHFNFGVAVASGAAGHVYGSPPAGSRCPSLLCAASFCRSLDDLAAAVRATLPEAEPGSPPATTPPATAAPGRAPTVRS